MKKKMVTVIYPSTICGDQIMTKRELSKPKSKPKDDPDLVRKAVHGKDRHLHHRSHHHRRPLPFHRLRPHHDIQRGHRHHHQLHRRRRQLRRNQRPSHVRLVTVPRPDLMRHHHENPVTAQSHRVRDRGRLPQKIAQTTNAVVQKTKDQDIGPDLVLVLLLVDHAPIRETFQTLHIRHQRPNTGIEMPVDRLALLAIKNVLVREALQPTRKVGVEV